MWSGDVHGNGKDEDPVRSMGFPREWEYDQPWDGSGNKMHGKVSDVGVGKHHCML